MQSPTNFSLLVDKKTIKNTVKSLVSTIEFAIDKNKETVLIGILKGAAYFLVDVSRAMNIDHSIAFIETSSYHGEVRGQLKINSTIDFSKYKNYNIVVLDELWDQGATMTGVKNFIIDQGIDSQNILTVTMFTKNNGCLESPDLYGMELDDVWLIGYGMDNDGKCRNLREVYKKN